MTVQARVVLAMGLTKNEAREICTHLAAAMALLKVSSRVTDAISQRVEVIRGNLDPAGESESYNGDAGAAKNALDLVVDDLARLITMRPAVAVVTERMIPNVKPELPPGVANAIDQIGKAVQILRLARDRTSCPRGWNASIEAS